MTRDDHRAPSRLAPPRPTAGRRAPSAAPGYRPAHQRPAPDPEDVVEGYSIDDDHPEEAHEPRQPLAGANGAGGSGVHRFDDPPPRDYDDHPAPRETYAPAHQPIHRGAIDGDLSPQERHQLLIHTIQLYDDEWQLARIQANAKMNWLVAYLLPRDKRLDLRTALARQQALVITIDSRGNTDIKKPRNPGLFRRLLGWLFG